MTKRCHRISLLASAVLFASALVPLRAIADPVDLPIDEYLCYQAKETKITQKATGSKFTGFEFGSKDQFEPADQRNYLAQKYASLCNPIDPAANAGVHLLELKIKDSKLFPNDTKFVPPTSVYSLADRLGMVNSVIIKKPKTAMVRVGKTDWGTLHKCKVDADCVGNGIADDCNELAKICQVPPAVPPLPPVPAAPTDLTNTADYVCYQLKGPKLVFPDQSGVEDQFDFPDDYQLKKITKICAPTDKAAPNAAGPNAPDFAGHLICYQAKSLKANINPVTGKANKFLTRVAAINGASAGMPNGDYLEVKKITEICIPALKAVGDTAPTYETPTILDTISEDAGGVCGSITVTTGGVPNRLDPNDAQADPNDVCTGAGAPLACCEDVDEGHCNEATTITCGSLTFGGGGPSVGNPGSESGSSAGQITRYSLSCSSPSDTACTISGNSGDIPNAVNCSTSGCGGVTPIDTTDPIRVCSYNTLGADASGALNLATGEVTLNTTTNATVYINTVTSVADSACPKCRTSSGFAGLCSVTPLNCYVDDDCPVAETCSVNIPAVFASGGLPGSGVCDADSLNAGAPCFTFEPAGSTAGLTSDCDVDAGGSGVIAIATTASSNGASMSDPNGHFCGTGPDAFGQGGNSDCTFGNSSCTGAGAPQACCTGVGMGTCVGQPQSCCTGAGMGGCNNFNGCFGSANALGNKATYGDITGICTGISVTGTLPGLLISGSANDPVATYGAVDCIPSVSAGPVLSPLVNNNAGLPGPVVTSSKVRLHLQ